MAEMKTEFINEIDDVVSTLFFVFFEITMFITWSTIMTTDIESVSVSVHIGTGIQAFLLPMTNISSKLLVPVVLV